jgi:hypothetical protein
VTTNDFKRAVKAKGLSIKKIRGRDVFRISRGNHAIADARFEDIYYVSTFHEWFAGKIAPKLAQEA